MRTTMALALALFSVQPLFAAAATFSVDAAQSYVAVDMPTWQRGAPWGLALPGGDQSGGSSVGGYQWVMSTETQRFGLSGSLDVSPADGLRLALDPLRLVALTPAALGFQLPRFASFDSARGALQWSNSCADSSSSFPILCLAPTRSESLSGVLSGGRLNIDGASHELVTQVSIGEILYGGLETPPLPDYSPATLGYTYHLVATIPEPGSALMMLAGLATLLLRRAR